MLEIGADLFREGLFDPFAFHGRRQGQQGQILGAPSGHLSDRGHDQQRSVLHHTFPDQYSAAAFGQITIQRAQVAPDAKLIDEAGHERTQQRFVPGWATC